MQYQILATGETEEIEITDGTVIFRIKVNGDDLDFDQYDVSLWRTIDSLSLSGINQEEFRLGVRSGEFVIDQSITGGFGGEENIGWKTIVGYKLL